MKSEVPSSVYFSTNFSVLALLRKVPSKALFIGRFEVATSGGLVQPGQSVSVTVRYSPEGANAHRESICLKVTHNKKKMSQIMVRGLAISSLPFVGRFG